MSIFQIEARNPILSKPTITENGEITINAHAPHILCVNKFSEESAKEFLEGMINAQNTGQTIIPVVIDSYGGEVYSLLKMIDIIRSSPVPVATICMGKAMSCGAILLSCGADGQRYIAPSATVMLHDAASYAFGKVEDIKVEAKEITRLNDQIYSVLDENCKQAPGYFKKLVHDNSHADLYFNANDTLKHGIVNHVRIPKAKVVFDVAIDFG